MGSKTTPTGNSGFATRFAALGVPRQIAFVFAIIAALVSLVELLIGVDDAYDRFVKLMAVIMATEVVIVFALEIGGITRRSWLRRFKFLVTVLSGHIVLFTLAGALIREGSGEILLLVLGAIILVANLFGRVEPVNETVR